MSRQPLLNPSSPIGRQPMSTDVLAGATTVPYQSLLTLSPIDVVQTFLAPLRLADAWGDTFIKHKISGALLVCLTIEDLRDMGVNIIGDRILLMETLAKAKIEKKHAIRNTVLWSGETPARECVYACSDGFCLGLQRLMCPCCVNRESYSVTGSGIRLRNAPGACGCCAPKENLFLDYRFLQDVELDTNNCCCCCGEVQVLRIYGNEETEAVVLDQMAREKSQPKVDVNHIVIKHPDAARAHEIIQNAWADARLVVNN